MLNPSKRDGVIGALIIGDPNLERLYTTSAWFKTSLVHFVENVLPQFVDGLAINAEKQDAELEQAKARLAAVPPLRIAGYNDDES